MKKDLINKFPSIAETEVLSDEMMESIESGECCSQGCEQACLKNCQPGNKSNTDIVSDNDVEL